MPPKKDRDSLQSWKDSMYAARCGDCHWFRNYNRERGDGDCLVYPPTVVGLGGDNGVDYSYPTVNQDSRCRLFLVSQTNGKVASDENERKYGK